MDNINLQKIINTLVEVYNKYTKQINIFSLILGMILAYTGFIKTLITNLIVLSYLLVLTIRSIDFYENEESEESESCEPSTIMIYWVCYSIFISMESIVDFLMIFSPLGSIGPVYYASKLGFFYWIVRSKDNPNLVYRKVIYPLYKQYKKHIDVVVQKGEDMFEQAHTTAEKMISHKGKDILNQLLDQSSDDSVSDQDKKLK